MVAADVGDAAGVRRHGCRVGDERALRGRRFSDEGSGVEGWISHYGQPGNRLYVNRGIGFSVVPARIHAAPELTVFTLTVGR